MEEYWTVSFGVSVRNGMSCRECKQTIFKGEEIAVRDGRRIRLTYHKKCFSGDADPRSQAGSSFNEGRMPKSSFSSAAPAEKGRGKWSVKNYGYNPAYSALESAGSSTSPIENGKKKKEKKQKKATK